MNHLFQSMLLSSEFPSIKKLDCYKQRLTTAVVSWDLQLHGAVLLLAELLPVQDPGVVRNADTNSLFSVCDPRDKI